jgi:RPA family protein
MSEPAVDRATERLQITEHLLDALEQVVWRYRAMKPATDQPDQYADRYADVVTAEVAQQLAVARGALRRHPIPAGRAAS